MAGIRDHRGNHAKMSIFPTVKMASTISSTITITITTLTPLSSRHASASIPSRLSRNPPSSEPLTDHRWTRGGIGASSTTSNSTSGGRRPRDGAAAADGLSGFPGRRITRPLPSLSLRLQVLHPSPPLLRLLQLRPHHPLMSSSSASASAVPTPSNTSRVVIKGRVQGVFYRNWTVDNSQQLGLKGWVRNRRDGSVEALFSGEPESVAEMERRCRRGPPDAIVTSLQVFPSDEDPGDGFECRPTA